MEVEVRELEIADYDLFENIKTALYRLWKFKLVVVLMTLVGLLLSLIYISIVGVKVNYQSTATIYSMVYGSYEVPMKFLCRQVALQGQHEGILRVSAILEWRSK